MKIARNVDPTGCKFTPGPFPQQHLPPIVEMLTLVDIDQRAVWLKQGTGFFAIPFGADATKKDKRDEAARAIQRTIADILGTTTAMVSAPTPSTDAAVQGRDPNTFFVFNIPPGSISSLVGMRCISGDEVSFTILPLNTPLPSLIAMVDGFHFTTPESDIVYEIVQDRVLDDDVATIFKDLCEKTRSDKHPITEDLIISVIESISIEV
jgi:hypothetical protein